MDNVIHIYDRHRVYKRFQGTGSIVQPPHHIREGGRVRTFDVELDVQLYTHENPTSSLRQASSVLGISKETIRRIRVAYNMYLYRPYIVHCLLYTSDAADERSSVDL